MISLDADYCMKGIGCWTPDQVGGDKRLGKRAHFDKGPGTREIQKQGNYHGDQR